MKKHYAVAGLAAISMLALTACQGGFTSQPRATMFPSTDQQVLRSADHWNVLANNEAKSIVSAVPDGAMVGVVEPPISASPFERSYHKMLVSSLVANGAQVAISPAQASYQVQYSIDVVEHTDRSSVRPRPGTITAAFVVGAIASTVGNWAEPAVVALPVLGAGEAWLEYWKDTDGSPVEAVITTRVHNGTRYAASTTNVYYIKDADRTNYSGGARTFRVVSGGASE